MLVCLTIAIAAKTAIPSRRVSLHIARNEEATLHVEHQLYLGYKNDMIVFHPWFPGSPVPPGADWLRDHLALWWQIPGPNGSSLFCLSPPEMEQTNSCLGLGESGLDSFILPYGSHSLFGTHFGAWHLILKPNYFPNRAQWIYNANTHQLTMNNLNDYGLKTKGVSCLTIVAEQGNQMNAQLTNCLGKGDEHYFTQNFTVDSDIKEITTIPKNLL